MGWYLGDYLEFGTVDFKFVTHGSSGGLITMTGGTVQTLVGNGTTAGTNGVTLTTNFNGGTGLHHVRITLASGTEYVGPNDFQVTFFGTVDGVQVRDAWQFSIRNRSNPTILDRGNFSGTGGVGTSQLRTGLSFGNDYLNGAGLMIFRGPGSGQTTNIFDYVQTGTIAHHSTLAAAGGTASYYEVHAFGVVAASTSNPTPADVVRYGGSAGTFAEGRPSVNMTHAGGTILAAAGGTLSVNATTIGGNVPAQTTAGILDTNVTHFGGAAGTFAQGRPTVNTSHLAGTAIAQSAGTAQVVALSLGAQAKLDVGTAALKTQLGTTVPADGTAPTLEQAAFGIQQFLQERDVSGTILTVRDLAGSGTVMTFTLNGGGTAPTSLTRAS